MNLTSMREAREDVGRCTNGLQINRKLESYIEAGVTMISACLYQELYHTYRTIL